MIKLLRKLEVKIRFIIWAITQLKEPTTYDKVIFKGEEYYIKYGNPFWKLGDKKGQFKKESFKIVRSIKRDWNVFKQRYNFQKTSWYSIDYNNPLFTRISYLSSDNIRFRTRVDG